MDTKYNHPESAYSVAFLLGCIWPVQLYPVDNMWNHLIKLFKSRDGHASWLLGVFKLERNCTMCTQLIMSEFNWRNTVDMIRWDRENDCLHCLRLDPQGSISWGAMTTSQTEWQGVDQSSVLKKKVSQEQITKTFIYLSFHSAHNQMYHRALLKHEKLGIHLLINEPQRDEIQTSWLLKHKISMQRKHKNVYQWLDKSLTAWRIKNLRSFGMDALWSTKCLECFYLGFRQFIWASDAESSEPMKGNHI